MSDDKFTRENISNLAIDIAIRLGVLYIVVYICYLVINPFLTIVIWGAILAVTLYPVQQWMARKLFGGRGGIASTVIVLIGLAVIFGPVGLLSAASIESINELESGLVNGTINVPAPPDWIESLPIIGKKLHDFWALTSSDFGTAMAKFGPQITELANTLLKVATALGFSVLHFSASIIVAGLFFGPGTKLVEMIRAIEERLVTKRSMQFIDLTGTTIQNVARGVMGVALLQAVAAGIGYLAIDYPFGGVLTVVVLILSILNMAPTVIVLASIAYGWTFMDLMPAILFTVYMIPVGLLDNVLRPIIVAKGLPVPIAVMFVGVIGGALAGGLLGLFIGPVVLAVAYQLLTFWLVGKEPAMLGDETDDPAKS